MSLSENTLVQTHVSPGNVTVKLGDAVNVEVTDRGVFNAENAADTRRVQEALGRFLCDVGRHPTEAEGLQALFTRPPTVAESKWKGPYLDDERLVGRFDYVSPQAGRGYEITTK